MNEKIELISNIYFTAFVNVKQTTSTMWFCWGELMRNDTSERDPRRYGARGDSKEHAIAEVTLKLNAVIQEKGMPYDWKKPDKVRQILWKYLEFWDEQNWRNQSGESLKEFEKMIMIELVLLDEEDQVCLLTASDYAYNNPVRDLDNLNENSARFRLYELIKNPGEIVKQAYAMHEQRLTDTSEKEKERTRLDSISTKYFTAFISAICVSPRGWIGTGELMRNDTTEMCPRRLVGKGDTKQSALDAVILKLTDTLMNCESPSDWDNPDPIRQLLWRYIEFQRGPKEGVRLSEKECEEINVVFANELNLLTEDEQIRLFTEMENNCNIDYDYSNFVNRNVNFYDFHSRMGLFELIESPPEKVTRAYKKYMRYLKEIRDK